MAFQVLNVILSLWLFSFYAHAAVETIQYGYDDVQQVRDVIYDDGASGTNDYDVNYIYDTSGNRLSKGTVASGTSNSPPDSFTYFAPANVLNPAVPLTVTLEWNVSTDPDSGDVVVYDIYLGTSAFPPLIISGHLTTSYTVSLEHDTQYFWKIIARDNHNTTTDGIEWSFTTDNIPAMPLAADFNTFPNNIIGPVIINFLDNSLSHNNSITAGHWDFDNDGTEDSSLQNPSALLNPGTYDVALTVDDAYGRTNTVTKAGYLVILADSDGDGIDDDTDNCSTVVNPEQSNVDGDSNGDLCDSDLDADGIPNNGNPLCAGGNNLNCYDNCPFVKNQHQDDYSDGIGDLCDTDIDEDGVDNVDDNCPMTPNGPGQGTCINSTNPGSLCINNGECPGGMCSLDQEDSEGDGYGDSCTTYVCIATTDSAGLQTVLNDAKTDNTNNIIQLEQGTYSVQNNNNLRFKHSSSQYYSLVIKGGYESICTSRTLDPSNTILDGALVNGHVNKVLEITNMGNPYPDADWLGILGGSIYIEGVTIQNGQKGIYVHSEKGDVTVKDSIIQNNANDPIWDKGSIEAKVVNGKMMLLNNVIKNNKSQYTTAYLSTDIGEIVLSNNIITGNRTAFDNGGGVTVYITNIKENGAARVILTNNTITENRTTYSQGKGGGIFFQINRDSTDAYLFNNIVWNNSAPAGGDDIYITSSTGTISTFDNLIGQVYGNFSDDIDNNYVDSPSFVAVGSWNGDSWAEGDYHLSNGSVCINTGNNLAYSLQSTDFDGNPRIFGSAVDIGAYEVVSDISVSPQSYDFSHVNIGNSSDQIIAVTNNGTADLTIFSVIQPSAPFSIASDNCSNQTIAPLAQCTINVRFQPTGPGNYSDNMYIPSNDPDENPTTVYLSGSGNALPIAVPNGPYNGEEGKPITLDGTGSYDPDGTIALYEWDIDGDGNYDCQSSNEIANCTCPDDGVYITKLRVTDSLDITSNATTSANITDTAPTADFAGSPTAVPANKPVYFSDNSTAYDLPLIFNWDFDNNGAIDSSDQNPSYIYNVQGTYSVKLTVTDSDSSQGSLIMADYITVTPSVYNLTITKTGSGNGRVTGSPTGIDCGNDCTEEYQAGSLVNLTPSPDAGSEFNGWTEGDCTGIGDCMVTVNIDTSITATFDICANFPVRISGAVPAYYPTIQAAYDAAQDGDTIQSQAVRFTESPDFNINKTVTLDGGYNCVYSSVSGRSVINGDINITDGSVTLENLILE
jgi:PKD repeat protein